MLGRKFFKVLLRAAVEGLKFAVEGLQPGGQRGSGRCGNGLPRRHQKRIELIAISCWIKMEDKLQRIVLRGAPGMAPEFHS